MAEEIRNYYCEPDFEIEVCHFDRIEHDFPVHFHEYYIVGAIEDDQKEAPYEDKKALMELIYKKQSYVLKPGDILLCNPFDCHSCRHLGNGYYSYFNVAIKPQVMKEIRGLICGEEGQELFRFLKPVERNEELQGLVQEMFYAVKDREGRFYKEELLIAIVEVLCGQKLEWTPDPEGICAPVEAVCEYMENHFDEHIDLDILSELFGYSKYHLIRVFSKVKGISPHGYLESIRIRHAKQLLNQGEPPCDVTHETGYYDQSHFTKTFKRIVGLTPRQFIRYNIG